MLKVFFKIRPLLNIPNPYPNLFSNNGSGSNKTSRFSKENNKIYSKWTLTNKSILYLWYKFVILPRLFQRLFDQIYNFFYLMFFLSYHLLRKNDLIVFFIHFIHCIHQFFRKIYFSLNIKFVHDNLIVFFLHIQKIITVFYYE